MTLTRSHIVRDESWLVKVALGVLGLITFRLNFKVLVEGYNFDPINLFIYAAPFKFDEF